MKFNIARRLLPVMVNWSSKFFTLAMQIIIMPLLFKDLGVDNFALYNFLVGLSGWFVLCDLSSGLVLQNKISKNEVDKIRNDKLYIYSFGLYLALFCIFFLLLMLLSLLIYKYFVVNISHLSFYSFMYVWVGFVFVYLGNSIFLNTIKVYYSLGLNFKINLINLVATIIGYVLLLLILKLKIHNAFFYIVVVSLLPNLMLNIFYYYRLIDNKEKVIFNEFVQFIREIFIESRYFFLIGLNSILILQLDYLFIAHFLNGNDVIQYSLYAKIFGAVFAFYLIVLSNFYAVCARNIYSRNYKKVFYEMKINIIFGVIAIVFFTLLIYIFKNKIATYFFANKVQLHTMLLICFGLYYIIRVWVDTLTIPFLTMNKSKMLLKFGIYQVVLSVSLQYILIQFYGIVGLMMGIILAFLATIFWIYPLQLWKLLSNRSVIS